MKIPVQKNHLRGLVLYIILDPSKKRRHRHTSDSLCHVISAHFPKLAKSIQKIPVDLLGALQRAEKIQSRKLGVRECITFAARLTRHQTELSGSKRVAFAVLDAIDIFAAHLTNRADREKFIKKICEIHSDAVFYKGSNFCTKFDRLIDFSVR